MRVKASTWLWAALVVALAPLLGFKKEDAEFRCYMVHKGNCTVWQGEAGAVLIRFFRPPVSVRGELWKGEFAFKSETEDKLFWSAYVPAGRYQTPGEYLLHIFAGEALGGETEFLLPMVIEPRQYAVERLTLPDEMVDLSPEAVAVVNNDNKVLLAAMSGVNPEILREGAFVAPVPGPLDANFGMGRIVNNMPKSPHNGVDLKASEGQEVAAANSGRVAKVYQGYLTGRAVILDHGGGMYSVYFHLSKPKVSEGELVRKGQVIALSGSTGRSSGPHLHFAVRLNKVYVNPKSVVDASAWLADTVSNLKQLK